MKKTFLSLVVIAALSSSCAKKATVNCSNAQLCVQNKSTKVVHFAWNSSMYNDSIMPNGSACKYVGQVTINNTTTQTPTTNFNSDRGDYLITVRECNQSQIIN